VSSPQSRRPTAPVRERAACMCAHGGSCTRFAPGHALHLIQARLAAATPSDWTDAVVEAADALRGEVIVRTLEGAAVTVWNAAGAATTVAPGDPVALHGRYDVLAAAGQRFNVARLG
jgi:hypothetical protein